MKYRPEIDGLRALAVIPVMLFHLKLPYFTGGYVGVDVFFVISGFLITSIIFSEIKSGNFSILNFFERRARRILPALTTVIFVSAVIGYVIFLPYDFRDFGINVIGATLFAANFVFWLKSGYFESGSEINPLLHMWSLSAEEQFYIVYPVILLSYVFLRQKKLFALLALIAAISFILSVWGSIRHPGAAFFLPHTRFWEFLLGALLALHPFLPVGQRSVREIMGFMGFGLIVWSIVTFTSSTPYPGLNALIPCLGTLFIIRSTDSGETLLRKLLCFKPIVYLGLISYSLYLWHWPMIVFYKYYWNRELQHVEIILILALTLLLASFSWRYIEMPFRKRIIYAERRMLALFFASVGICLTVLGSGAYLGLAMPLGSKLAKPEHIPGREFYNVRTCFLEPDQSPDQWNLEDCLLTTGKEKFSLLWGDSYAAHYAPGIQGLGDLVSSNVIQYTAGSCPPVFGVPAQSNAHCIAFNEGVKRIISAKKIQSIVISARWERYLRSGEISFQDIQNTMDDLSRYQVTVILIGQSPVFPHRDPYYMYYLREREGFRNQNFYSFPIVVDENVNSNLAGLSNYDVFIDPIKTLCVDNYFPIFEGGNFVIIDNGHLSAYGSRKYMAAYARVFRENRVLF